MKGALVTLMLTVLLTLTSTSSAAQDPGTSAQTAGRCKSTARHGLDCPQFIKAREGGSVTIQCRVDPTINLTSCTVDLKRRDLNKFVYVYRHENDDPDPVLEDYRDRVTLNKEYLPKGVVTLQISLLNRSDSGPYRVNINGQTTSTFNLTVDPPQVICPTQPVEAVEGEDVPLRCHLDPEVNLSSFTVDWKRVDLNKIVYSYRHQKEDHGDQLAWYRNRTFMNLTLLISSVQQNDSGPYRCFVPKWRISCTITLSVVTKDQRNRTVRPGLTTAAPPVEEADHPSVETAKLDGVGVGVVVVIVIIVIIVLVAWFKRRNIKDWTRKLRRRRKQREEMGNGDVLRRLRDDQDPNAAALNESRDQRV